jgi:Protein of unknown function (DUF4019)
VPGAPDGRYVILKYATSFENKKDSVETVTTVFDNDGKWRVAGLPGSQNEKPRFKVCTIEQSAI